MTRWSAPLRHAAALFGAALGVCAGAGSVQAQAWQPTEDDQLLLELRSGAYKLGEPMRGYQTPAGVCIDFADLIQNLDLPVRLDKKSRRATGWLFAEDQRFVLDRDANTVQNVNGTRGIAANAILDTPEGWCMDLGALSGWMGVRFKSDLGNLTVVLESDRKLPFLEAIERKSRAARLQPRSFDQFDLAKLPQAQLPYKTWRAPSVDIQLQAQWSKAGGTRVQYEALAAGELLGMSYTARLAGEGLGPPDSLRLRAYRNDPAGELLGPLKATQVAIGDVDLQRGNLTGQSAYGRGAVITNQPINRPARFGVTALRGTLPTGWDAELYRNGELRAFQSDRGDGRYDFNDVELLFGDNEFEVVLYGPQGQIKRERSSVPVGQARVPAGQTLYWAGIAEEGRDLIDFTSNFADPQTGWRWGVGVEHGLSKRTSVGVEYQSLMLAGQRRQYLEAKVDHAFGPVLVGLSGAQQLGGGQAVRAEALGKLGPVRFNAQVLWVNGDFDSDLVRSTQRRDASLRLSSAIPLGSWRLPVEVGYRQSLQRNGAKVNELLLRTSAHFGRMSLAAELLQRSATGSTVGLGLGDTGTKLNLIANTMLGGVRLRGSARIALSGPKRGLETAQVMAETRFARASTVRLGLDYDAQANRRELMLGVVHQFKKFAVRAEGRADNRGNRGISLTLGFSLGPDPVSGGIRLARERLAEEGQASIEVYRDENGDGIRQAGEEAVEGVTVEAGFRHSDKATNPDGRAVINGLTPYVPVLISIDAGTLPDPLLQPKGQGMVVVPRPGVAAKVELPLAPTGEIEAILLGPDGEPRAGVPIELVDMAGQMLLQTRSDFDGYTLFDSVPYGQYRLRVHGPSAQILGVKPDIAGTLTLDRTHASLRLGRLGLEAGPRGGQVAVQGAERP